MSAPVLVCFAVPQEAKPFRQLVSGKKDLHCLVTGMGTRNAERAILKVLPVIRPVRVYTCGFAGGLNPALQRGSVVFDAATTPPHLVSSLLTAGASAATFASSERVAITIAEKAALRASTGADAVEMESATIHRLCREAHVACVTLRVISDSEEEDLPLDFNKLMTAEQNLSPTKLAWAILKHPQRIPALLRLGRHSTAAAQRLAKVLVKVI